MPASEKINCNFAKLSDGNKVRYLNINNKPAEGGGKLFEGMMNSDKPHPALKGYQVWADAIGPPAQEDRAPPPTGDPGAKPHFGRGVPVSSVI
jgi:hypothetical protein